MSKREKEIVWMFGQTICMCIWRRSKGMYKQQCKCECDWYFLNKWQPSSNQIPGAMSLSKKFFCYKMFL